MSKLPELSRRGFLRAGGLVVGAGILTACGSSSASTSSSSTPSLVRIGAEDSTQSSGLDIRSMGYGASYVLMYHLFDSLAYLTDTGYQLGLARSITPNADATAWTITLPAGVRFHDGRPVQAADVVYTLQVLASKTSNRASVFAVVDIDRVTAPNPTTVVVPLKAPRGDFVDSVLAVFSPIVPRGTTDYTKGIGSGPYKLAGQDGTTLSLVRNDAYWGRQPGIEQLHIVRIADPDARLNAVKSGQLDYAVSISAVSAQASKSDPGIQIRRGGAANSQALSFAMNQTIAPFTDPRVRQAVRLAADRDALVDTALLGYGTVGNDVLGKGLAGYDTALPQRKQDLAQATALFRAAGVHQLTLQAAEVVPGMSNASLLLVQQLAKAGVTLTLQQIPPQNFYASLTSLAQRPFQVFYYVNRPIEVHLSAVTAPGSTFNVTGLAQPWWTELAAAQAHRDNSARATAFTAMQQQLYDTGGDLVWAFQEQLDAARPGINGITTIQSTPVFRTATLS